MSSIVQNKARIGSFTSSEIHKLVKPGKSNEFSAPGLTYIRKKVYENRLGRSIDTGAYSRAIAWGELVEIFLFEKINDYYIPTGAQTVPHPSIDHWAGSPDFVMEGVKVADTKCYWPENFCRYVDVLITEDIERIKKEYEAEYWQLVSNSCILDTPKAEVICYMPYKEELEEIREFVNNYRGSDPWRYRFIVEDQDYQLPFIDSETSFYKNLNTFEFEVPQADKELLTERVIKAVEVLKAIL